MRIACTNPRKSLLLHTMRQLVPGDGDNTGKKKPGKKDSQLILRLDKDERDRFVALCKELDTSAAREIRRFIRAFVKRHKP